MKNKLTVNRLAMGNLRARKKQYAIMIIGIILAMVFSSGSIFFVYTMRDSAIEQSRQRFGSQYCLNSIEGADESVYHDMQEQGFFPDYGIAHELGYVYTDKERQGAQLAWLDEDCVRLSNMTILQGRYPDADGEIAVERTALLKLGYDDAKVGDTIDVNMLVQNDFDHLEQPVSKQYTLVGIVADKRQNMLSTYQDSRLNDLVPACFVARGTMVEPGGRERTLCYCARPNIGRGRAAWDDYFLREDKYYADHGYNSFKETIGVWSQLSLGTGTDISSGLNFITILSVVLMLASCLAIINAFNSNLKERRTQIGMLRAIGTTRRQIINIFGREAMIITLAATPVSIAISYGLVWLVAGLLKDNLVVSRNVGSLAVCVVVNIVVVMLSALIPLIRISKTSPMHAIRNVRNNRRMKTKRIRSARSFDMSTLLAKRYRMFYRTSNRIVCAILAITIGLSCIFFGFADSVIDDTFLGYGNDYLIDGLSDNYGYSTVNYPASENGLTNDERRQIEANPYVKETFAAKSCCANIMVPEYDDYLRCIKGEQDDYGGVYDYNGETEWNLATFADDCLSDTSDMYKSYKSTFRFNSDYVPTTIYALDEKELRDIALYDGKLDIAALNSGSEVILVAPQRVSLEMKLHGSTPSAGWSACTYCDGDVDKHRNDDKIVLTGDSTFAAGDELKVAVVDMLDPEGYIDGSKDYKRYDRTTRIGGIVSPNAFDVINYGSGNDSCLCIVTTISGIDNFARNQRYDTMQVDVSTDVTADIDREMTDMLSRIADKHDATVSSNYELIHQRQEQQRTWILVIVSAVILAFAVCAGIINNTITANIRENKRELGTLRAVGAGEREIFDSYIKQLLHVFATGYGAGFGLYGAYLLVVIIDDLVISHLDTITISISPWITIIFCVVLFAICSLNLWLRIRREMKNSIIDNIREL